MLENGAKPKHYTKSRVEGRTDRSEESSCEDIKERKEKLPRNYRAKSQSRRTAQYSAHAATSKPPDQIRNHIIAISECSTFRSGLILLFRFIKSFFN